MCRGHRPLGDGLNVSPELVLEIVCGSLEFRRHMLRKNHDVITARGIDFEEALPHSLCKHQIVARGI